MTGLLIAGTASGVGKTATSYALKYSLSGREEDEGFTAGNILASYIHLYFRACPSIARHFVAATQSHKPPLASRELVNA
jgi:cobyrinic acid a,c-diamide synthase